MVSGALKFIVQIGQLLNIRRVLFEKIRLTGQDSEQKLLEDYRKSCRKLLLIRKERAETIRDGIKLLPRVREKMSMKNLDQPFSSIQINEREDEKVVPQLKEEAIQKLNNC